MKTVLFFMIACSATFAISGFGHFLIFGVPPAILIGVLFLSRNYVATFPEKLLIVATSALIHQFCLMSGLLISYLLSIVSAPLLMRVSFLKFDFIFVAGGVVGCLVGSILSYKFVLPKLFREPSKN